MEFIKKHSILLEFLLFLVYVALCFNDPYLTIICVQSIINAIAVIGIVLISGYTNQVHLGQSAFVGIGAYTSAVLMTKLGLSFWVTIPCAIILTAVMGVVLGIPALKVVGGPYLAMVTMLFGEIIYLVILNWEDVTGGSFGINRIPAPSIGSVSLQNKSALLVMAAIFFVIAFFVARRLVQSKYGRFFLSIRESEAAAQSVGVNTMRYKIMAFSLSSAFAGIAGILYAQCFSYLSAEQFRWGSSQTLISMAIIGGIGSLEGGALGAIILTALPEMLRGFDAQMRMITYGVLVILTLIFLPDGLISLFGKKPSEIRAMFKERISTIFIDERASRGKKLKNARKAEGKGSCTNS